jgi:mycothiol maleylpyruvate isomerase-like protein
MDEPDRILFAESRRALQRAAGRVADLLRSLPDLAIDIPGTEWTVREVGVHLLTGTTLCADIATGMPSPVSGLSPDILAAENAARIADIPESDPTSLARLLEDAADRVLHVTAHRRGGEIVVWHGGRRISLAHLVAICTGEQLLHGFDIAAASGRAWTFEPAHIRLVVDAYAAIDEGEFQLESLQGRTSWISL